MEQRYTRLFIFIAFSLFFASCSVTKHLPEEELLYTGIKGIEISARDSSAIGENTIAEIEAALAYPPNNALLGSSSVRIPFPFGLWMYNALINKEGKIGKWMFRKLAAKPVYISTVNPEVRVKVAQNLLKEYGYFRGEADFELVPHEKDPKQAGIRYHIAMRKPYTLDSIRLQSELAKHFGVPQSDVTGCRTYGGHGEQMAVFASTAKVQGTPLLDLIGTDKLTAEQWAEIQQKVVKGGANIINLRGRSSFQSPSYVSVEMIRAAMGGAEFQWPAGRYVSFSGMDHIMMAMEVTITENGAAYEEVAGTAEEMAALKKSYEHLCAMRDEVIAMGVLPPVDQWNSINPNIA